ncbi:plasmid replication protein [Listeria sp. FSL L7-1509]|uniref:Plasmid replication protein n=1 Tax=Listeria immobilis TaxID=2713502 RepID=A0ABR6T030_9LIST|nr:MULTISPECIES: primase C-terminal domain-containing protein [Listeria]MBC1484584.1 plasmid replication protein [Listeria immobilis]MBC1508274.1 plasmid replication protein [Listeria immobilis]MBC1511279.1 plasmid replication protein [Listeria immobilis]MBC1839525.1 plasmid replication protein [Listeria seeligeri]MBC6313685.1 plasmid replication protein [Listeria immobilis]
MYSSHNEMDLYTYSAVISTVVKEGITAFRKKSSDGVLSVRKHFTELEAKNGHRKGVQFVVRQKEDLQRPMGVRGFIVTSQEALIQEVNKISHWTPNVFRWGTYSDDNRKFIKGHSEENLQQINTYVIDIDTQQVDVAKMVMVSMKILNQTPTFILKTNHGFQLYFVLENPVFISNKNNFKSLRVAKRIATNLKHAFAEEISSVDRGCNDFGFFRAPNTQNIIFENLANQIKYTDLISWSKVYSQKSNRPGLKLVQNSESFAMATNQEWFQQLVQLTNIRGHKGQYGRNNAVFTLALACYSSNKSYEEAYNFLDEFNTNLQDPLSQREVEKILVSAYSDKYKGANLEYIQGILETYHSNTEIKHSTAFIFEKQGIRVFRKHRKARNERQYSHFEEWEADLEDYIQKNILAGQTFVEKAQRELSEETKIPLATLKKLLKQSERIISRVEGKGRTAKTLLSTVAIVVEQAIRYAITNKQAKKEQYIQFLATFTEAAQYITQKLFDKEGNSESQNAILTALPERGSPGRQLLLLLDEVYKTRPKAHLESSWGT